MGIGTGTAMLISTALMAAGTAASYAMTPKAPMQDTTNYDLLRQTQQEADAESEAAKARQSEAQRREELRVQQMYGQDIHTSERGSNVLDIKETTLGSSDSDESTE